MARLFRPHIPLKVRCQVADRQLRTFGGKLEQIGRTTLRDTLDIGLFVLAGHFGCEVSELRLDHDPPLAIRVKVMCRGKILDYLPGANDPDHLFYRPHGSQHEGSHDVKTRIRGDHGQHPDRVLIKKARRLERGPRPKRSPPIKSRGFAKVKRPFQRRKP